LWHNGATIDDLFECPLNEAFEVRKNLLMVHDSFLLRLHKAHKTSPYSLLHFVWFSSSFVLHINSYSSLLTNTLPPLCAISTTHNTHLHGVIFYCVSQHTQCSLRVLPHSDTVMLQGQYSKTKSIRLPNMTCSAVESKSGNL
jgi:hypothetical protein